MMTYFHFRGEKVVFLALVFIQRQSVHLIGYYQMGYLDLNQI